MSSQTDHSVYLGVDHALHLVAKYLRTVAALEIRRRGVVGRVPAFQSSVPGSILGGKRNFNSYHGIGCVSFVCVLSCAIFGGGPDHTFREARPSVSV